MVWGSWVCLLAQDPTGLLSSRLMGNWEDTSHAGAQGRRKHQVTDPAFISNSDTLFIVDFVFVLFDIF